MFNREKLDEYLKREGLSHREFAEKVGVSQVMITYIINGFKQPSIGLLQRISKMTGISADELINEN